MYYAKSEIRKGMFMVGGNCPLYITKSQPRSGEPAKAPPTFAEITQRIEEAKKRLAEIARAVGAAKRR